MPRVRLLFDELLPQVVARALRELGFRVSHVGNVDDGSPAYGASDEEVLAHARQTNQVIVTSNHDMIVLCAEQVASVVWTDPRGRQFRRAELVVVAFGGIEQFSKRCPTRRRPCAYGCCARRPRCCRWNAQPSWRHGGCAGCDRGSALLVDVVRASRSTAWGDPSDRPLACKPSASALRRTWSELLDSADHSNH